MAIDSTQNHHDDAMPRKIFDSPPTWMDFSKTSSPWRSACSVECVLTGPDGFNHFANASLKRARRIRQGTGASSREEYRAIVRHLDRLSDLLCRVLDLSDFVRVTHPDTEDPAGGASRARGIAKSTT